MLATPCAVHAGKWQARYACAHPQGKRALCCVCHVATMCTKHLECYNACLGSSLDKIDKAQEFVAVLIGSWMQTAENACTVRAPIPFACITTLVDAAAAYYQPASSDAHAPSALCGLLVGHARCFNAYPMPDMCTHVRPHAACISDHNDARCGVLCAASPAKTCTHAASPPCRPALRCC